MDTVFKILELVGTSNKSIEDATQKAISLASNTIDDMKWFKIVETRGSIDDQKISSYQVVLKVGFAIKPAVENNHTGFPPIYDESKGEDVN